MSSKLGFQLKKHINLQRKMKWISFWSCALWCQSCTPLCPSMSANDTWIQFTHALYVTHKRMLKLRCLNTIIHLPSNSVEHNELILKQSLRGPKIVHCVQWLGYRVESSGFNSQLNQEIFSSPKRPDGLWGSPKLLFNGKRRFFCWS
jgi:hypothetical protein